MAHQPVHSYGLKRHSCGYSNPPKMDTYPSRPRPPTRRHPEDSPQCMTVDVSHTAQEKKHRKSTTKLNTDEELKQCCPRTKKISEFKKSVEDQEYLQFLLRITEDIIRYDLYSNEEMKRVFSNHVKANKNRLELDRMLMKIYELMKELNIPLCCEKGEKVQSSWTDIVLILRSLLRLEKTNSSRNQVDDTLKKSTKKNCICFDLNKKKLADDADPTKAEIEKADEETYRAMSKFEISLDRLTEHTEPFSSGTTIKVSTIFSNFGDNNELPGFESLETPKASKPVLCDIYSKKNVSRSIQTLGRQSFARMKLQIRKYVFKRRKKKKHKKKFLKGIKDIPMECQTRYRTENHKCKIFISKQKQEPAVITLQEFRKNDSIKKKNCDEICGRETKNDYILLQGPVYLSKKFLQDKSIVLMQNQKYIDSQSLISTKSFSQTNENSKKIQQAKNDNKNTSEIYFDVKNGCSHIDNSESTRLCATKCPHKSNCSKLRLVDKHPMSPVTSANLSEKCYSTPHKDVQTDIPKCENHVPVLSQTIVDDVLNTIEIQTEDIPHNPTIVGWVFTSFNDSSDKENSEKHNVESGQSTSSEIVEHKEKISEEQNTAQDMHALEKETYQPKNLNFLLMNASKMETEDNNQSRLTDDTPFVRRSMEIPITDSLETSSTIPTLISTATVERTKKFLEVNEEVHKKTGSSLYSENKDESDEHKVQRKVSILKNPVIQLNPEIMAPDPDDPRKVGEAMIKTVESMKDRQTSRDPYLDKVLHEIESSRETRATEKSYTTDASERYTPPTHSALKSKLPYNARKATIDEEVALKPRGSQNEDHLEQSEELSATDTASESYFLSQLDDLAEIKGSPSQMKQIATVIADLEKFRHGKDVKGETEISATFDKLVETLKEQQLREEESQVNTESSSILDVKQTSTSRKSSGICCGLCSKKKTTHVVSFIEFEKNALSEEEYKEKSDAFEMALASLGQFVSQNKPQPSNEPVDSVEYVTYDQEQRIQPEEKDLYCQPSKLIYEAANQGHLEETEQNTNKVTSVRIADQTKNDLNPVETSKDKEGHT